MRTSPGHNALRKGRISLPNSVYLVTVTTADGQPLFAHTETAQTVSRCMVDAHCWGDARLLCWVLMPDHWHGLVELGTRDNLSLVVNRLKAVTTKRLRHLHRGLVWDRGFHDHALRCEDDLTATARYIVGNPLRARLVTHVLDYPYWGCIWL